MSNYSVGELRRSATIMTSGPGSIVDMRAENSPVSGVHLGLEDWDRETPLRGRPALIPCQRDRLDLRRKEGNLSIQEM
jgi:hypothetical protein